MPMMELTIAKGALGTVRATELVDKLTRLILKWEGAPDTPLARSIAWGFLNEVEDIRVDGKSRGNGDAAYRVYVTVPAGALSDRRKTGLVEDVTAAILDEEGSENNERNRMRVFCVIQEVPDGNWGAGGRIYRLADIAAAVNAPVV